MAGRTGVVRRTCAPLLSIHTNLEIAHSPDLTRSRACDQLERCVLRVVAAGASIGGRDVEDVRRCPLPFVQHLSHRSVKARSCRASRCVVLLCSDFRIDCRWWWKPSTRAFSMIMSAS